MVAQPAVKDEFARMKSEMMEELREELRETVDNEVRRDASKVPVPSQFHA